jgi:selenide,water dikinase
MRGAAKSRWIDRAIQSMLVSNRAAVGILQRRGATACTDVTGFGLLGHAVEMAKASNVALEIRTSELPLLEGAAECVKDGIMSTLYPDNLRSQRAISNIESASKLDRFPLLFDPQTAGGLLGSVPSDRATQCLTELQRNGYAHAAIIGRISPISANETPISVS